MGENDKATVQDHQYHGNVQDSTIRDNKSEDTTPVGHSNAPTDPGSEPSSWRLSDGSSIPAISSSQFAQLLRERLYRRSLDPPYLFPWLNGIGPTNEAALAYYNSIGVPPLRVTTTPYTSAGTLLVATGDLMLEEMELTGAVHVCNLLTPPGHLDHDEDEGIDELNSENPSEQMSQTSSQASDQTLIQSSAVASNNPTVANSESWGVSRAYSDRFLDLDTQSGLRIRNFGAQPVKYAQCCDIVVYVPEPDPGRTVLSRDIRVSEARRIAEKLQQAQARSGSVRTTVLFPDLVVEALAELTPQERELTKLINHSALTADPKDMLSGMVWDYDMPRLELQLLRELTASTQIETNVWLGNSLDAAYVAHNREAVELVEYHRAYAAGVGSAPEVVLIARCDYATTRLPLISELERKINALEVISAADRAAETDGLVLEFPGDGDFGWPVLNRSKIAQLLNVCVLVDAASRHGSVLICCKDGYRASSMLSLLFIMYKRAFTLDMAIEYLQNEVKRAFSMSSTVVEVLYEMQGFLIALSPQRGAVPGSIAVTLEPNQLIEVEDVPDRANLPAIDPHWVFGFDGRLPSRILPHLFLGSFSQARNHKMLVALGIKKVISIGDFPFKDDADGLLLQGSLPPAEGPATAHRYVIRNVPGFEEVLWIPEMQDNGVSSLAEYLPACLEFMADSEERQIPTLIHCQQGVSRSAALCIAEVMRSMQVNLPHAYLITRVRRLDILIQPNLRLMYDLMVFEESRDKKRRRTLEWPVLSREIDKMNEMFS